MREGEKAEAQNKCFVLGNPLTLDTAAVGLDLEEFDWRWKD